MQSGQTFLLSNRRSFGLVINLKAAKQDRSHDSARNSLRGYDTKNSSSTIQPASDVIYDRGDNGRHGCGI